MVGYRGGHGPPYLEQGGSGNARNWARGAESGTRKDYQGSARAKGAKNGYEAAKMREIEKRK